MKLEVLAKSVFRVSGMPPLTEGSVKQIAWAEDLRAVAMPKIFSAIDRIADTKGISLDEMLATAPAGSHSLHEIINHIAAIPSAKFWIDEGRHVGDSMQVAALLGKIAKSI